MEFMTLRCWLQLAAWQSDLQLRSSLWSAGLWKLRPRRPPRSPVARRRRQQPRAPRLRGRHPQLCHLQRHCPQVHHLRVRRLRVRRLRVRHLRVRRLALTRTPQPQARRQSRRRPGPIPRRSRAKISSRRPGAQSPRKKENGRT